MKPQNFNETFMELAVLETEDGRVIPGLWTEMRIDNDTIPEPFHKYSTRHSDESDWATPVTVENHPITVNFCGEFITTEVLDFGELDWIGVKGMYFTDSDSFTEEFRVKVPNVNLYIDTVRTISDAIVMKLQKFDKIYTALIVIETDDGRVIPGLWSATKIADEIIPKPFRKYSTTCNADDMDYPSPVTIEKCSVMKNFCGEFITAEAVDFYGMGNIPIKNSYFPDADYFYEEFYDKISDVDLYIKNIHDVNDFD